MTQNVAPTAQPGGITSLPVVPLRDLVIFPHTVRPFNVGRAASVAAVRAALASEGQVFLALQRDPADDNPEVEGIHTYGTIAKIAQFASMRDGKIKVWAEGLQRAAVVEYALEGDHLVAVLRGQSDTGEDTADRAVMAEIQAGFEAWEKLQHGLELKAVVSSLPDSAPGRFSDLVAANLPIKASEKQVLLTLTDVPERLTLIRTLLNHEIEKDSLDKKIQEDVKAQMEKAQREYYLNEKIKAIRKELGHNQDLIQEVDELRKRIETTEMPEEAKDRAQQELHRLEMMPPMSAETTVSRNYLEWLLNVPWTQRADEKTDLTAAHEILDRDHYGLDKIKDRILEFLAVRVLNKNPKVTILCFVGPPGVGKTSLAKSIAEATGRPFVRMSLGGVRDEAELRGHRRTYIGAYPGQVVQLMRRAGKVNPVFLLDEVDKVGQDFRGDMSSVLLEILDPEQNHSFHDHYLDVDYDLSQVFFICTANVTHTIPSALLDRMEVIHLTGYTYREKSEIARRYLVPRQAEACGVGDVESSVTDKGLETLVEGYTREAGVRSLEREIGSLYRKLARRKMTGDVKPPVLFDPALIAEWLGPVKFLPTQLAEAPEVGLVNGLAVTATGGDVLNIEVTTVKGKGTVQLTGQLGEVMRESANAALSYVRSRAALLGIDPETFEKTDLHLHAPEGATPKDGPSAGIAMGTAIASVFTGVPVRQDIAMTGEITLRGRVLGIGGVKDKVLAAHRMGIREVLLPEENRKDLPDIPEEVRSALTLRFVSHMDEVLAAALVRPPFVDAQAHDAPQVAPRSAPPGPAA